MPTKQDKFFDVVGDREIAHDFAKLRAFLKKKLQHDVRNVKVYPATRRYPHVRIVITPHRYAHFDMALFQQERLEGWGIKVEEVFRDGTFLEVETSPAEEPEAYLRPVIETTLVTAEPLLAPAKKRQPAPRTRQHRTRAA